MNLEESKAWLRGERSTVNAMSVLPMEIWEVRTAEADAAMMQKAYWILRAHTEGLLNASQGPEAPDMSDWSNWEEGDLLERLVDRGTNYFVGQRVVIKYKMNSGYLGIRDDFRTFYFTDFKWHSRPSAPALKE